MLYNDYKNKMIKAKKFKNIFNIIRWPLLGLVVAAIIAIITINSIKGSSKNGIEINSVYSYGEEINPSCEVKMSSVVRYEYKDSTNTWSKTKPIKVGTYEVRAISKGLFGNKVSSKKSFEIVPTNLNIDIDTLIVPYGKYPESRTTGLVGGDTVVGLSYTYDDLSVSNTLVNMVLSSIKIVNNLGEDVTNCYNISSNASGGKEISFTELSLILKPEISGKEYDGIGVSYKNQYTILYDKKAGYNDIISVETTIKNSSGEIVEEAITPDTYEASIKTVYINGANLNPNYNITTETSSFEISKRDIVIETSSKSKTYDGEVLESKEITLNRDLASSDNYSVVSNTTILNKSKEDNNVVIKIIDDNGNDNTSYYNISYVYGSLEVLAKDILVSTKSSSKTYDGLPLYCLEYECNDLILDDKINVLTNAEAIDAGVYENNLVVEVLNSDGSKSINYNITYNYGSLEIKTRDIKIKPLDEDSIYYTSSEHTYETSYHNYQIVEGEFVSGDDLEYIEATYSNDLYENAINAGIYNVSIAKRSSELSNYNISYDVNTFEIKKAPLKISAVQDDIVFNYGDYNYSGKYTVTDGILYDDIDLKLNVFFEQDGIKKDVYDVGEYDIVINSYDTDSDKISNYNISYDIACLTVLKKDIKINIIESKSIYNGQEFNIDLTKFEVDDEKVKEHIEITSAQSTPSNILNAGNYTLEIIDYIFSSDDYIKESNYNIILNTSTYIVEKRKVTIKISEIDDIVYDSLVHEIAKDNYYVVEGSFVDDDSIDVEIVDTDSKTIKNADTYNLYIKSYSSNLNSNYDIKIDNSTIQFIVNPFDVSITLENEEFIYDSYLHTPTNNFTLDYELFNGDEITITTKTKSLTEVSRVGLLVGAGEYKKYLELDDIDFISGGNDSIKSNYKFSINDAKINVLKKEITITPVSLVQTYYSPLNSYNEFVSTNTMDETKSGVCDNDTFTIKTNYNSENAIDLHTGSYTLSVEEIVRVEALYSLDYIVNVKESTLTVIARNITIEALDYSKTYDKVALKFIENNYKIIDNYINNEVSILPGNETFKLNTHFELDEVMYKEIVDVGVYKLVVDSISSEYEYIELDYNFIFKDAEYEIVQLALTIYATDQSVIYDGEEHSPIISTISYVDENKFIDTDVIYKIKGDYSFINSGKYYYDIEITGLTNDKLTNYYISYQKSLFEILKRHYIIKAYDVTHIYNGTSYKYDGTKFYAIEDDGTILDSHLIDLTTFTIECSYSSTPVNVGIYQIYITSYPKDLDNFTLEASIEYATLEIIKRKLTVTLNPFGIEYDGLDHYDDVSYLIVKDEDEEVSRVGFTGYKDKLLSIDMTKLEMINVGTYLIRLNSISFGNNIEAIILNEDVSYTISKRKIYIKPIDQTAVYNGKVQEISSEWEYQDGHLVTDERLISLDREQIIDIKICEENENDIINANTYNIKIYSLEFSDNYDVDYSAYATFIVTKRDVTITIDAQSIRVYNKKEQTNFSYTYKTYDGYLDETYENEFMDGSSIEITSYKFYLNGVLKQPIDVGIYTLVVDSYIDNPNFNMTFKDSTLEIVKRKILVEIEDQTKIYDNTKDTKYSGTYEILDLEAEEDTNALPLKQSNGIISYIDGDGINVGVYSYTLEYVELYDNITLLNSNYDITYETATYTILKRDITIELTDQVKEYDGTPFVYTSPTFFINALDSINYSEMLNISYEYFDSNNIVVSPVLKGTYTIKISDITGDELVLSNHNFITSEAILTIDILTIYVTLKDQYEMVYGDSSFDVNEGITYRTNRDNYDVDFDLTFIIGETTDYSLLNAGTYDILGSKINSYYLYHNGELLDNDSLNLIFENESELVINKRSINVGFVEKVKTYDGIEITIDELEPVCVNILDRDSNNITIKSILINDDSTTKILHAGNYMCTSIILEYISSDVLFASNYETMLDTKSISIAKILQKDVEVYASINGDSYKVYNSEFDELSYNITYKGSVDGDVLEFVSDFSGVEARTYEISFSLDSVSGNGYISDYSIEAPTLTYEIKKADLVVTSNNGSFVYDGGIHKVNTFTYQGLQINDNILCSDSTTCVDYGSYENILKYNITNSILGDTLVNDSYNITYIYGSITITKKNIEINSIGGDFIYGGYSKYYSSTGFIYVLDNEVYNASTNTETFTINSNKFSINKTQESKINYAGSVLDQFEIVIKKDNVDVSENFDITYSFSKYLTVSKKDISIEVLDSISLRYNGKDYDLTKLISIFDNENELYSNSDELQIKEYVLKDKDNNLLSVVHNANTYYFSLDEIKFIYNSNDVSENYNIVYGNKDSEIVVEKINLKLTTSSQSFVWDGNDKYNTIFTLLDKDNDKTISMYDESMQTTTISLVEGEYSISKTPLKAYDDNNKKLLNYSVLNEMVLSIYNTNGEDLLPNYVIEYEYGTLSFITSYELTYNKTVDYTGENFAIESINKGVVNYETSDVTSNFAANVSYYILNGSIVDEVVKSGVYTIVIDNSSIIISVNGILITYDELYESSIDLSFELTFEVSRIKLLYKTEITEMVYNGKPQTLGNNINATSVTDEDLIKDYDIKNLDDKYTIIFSSTITAIKPGSYYQTISSYKVLDENLVDVTSEFDLLNLDDDFKNITKYQAKLKIIRIELEVLKSGVRTTYDGIYHSLEDGTYDTTNLLEGHVLNYVSKIDVGSYSGVEIIDSFGNDVTEYYKLSNILKIDAIKITVQTSSASKVYDGEAFSSTDFSTTSGTLRDGHYIKVVSYTTITEVGSTKNRLSFKVYDSDGADVSNIYNIKQTYGILTIN